MNRYFIGLMMPPNIQEHLQALSQSIQAARANDQRYKVSWTLPADLHCTFLFIGETSDEEHLMSYMADIAHRLEPVALTISGADALVRQKQFGARSHRSRTHWHRVC